VIPTKFLNSIEDGEFIARAWLFGREFLIRGLPVRGESMLTLPGFSFKNFALGNLMKYAVIRTGGKQYRVSEGDLVKVEKLAGEVGEKVTLPDVLFVGGNDDVKIGSPLVANAKVTGEIVGQIRAKKYLVFKKKRRKSYSRQRGHRQYQTTLKITAIEA
jgi:large subunit ribosomal protein L21